MTRLPYEPTSSTFKLVISILERLESTAYTFNPVKGYDLYSDLRCKVSQSSGDIQRARGLCVRTGLIDKSRKRSVYSYKITRRGLDFLREVRDFNQIIAWKNLKEKLRDE